MEKLNLKLKLQWAIVLVLFLAILISSVSLRLGNIELLKDQTTGKYIPADPDACYEYRVANTLLTTGNLNGIDAMRNPGLNLTYTPEMLPRALVVAYKTMHAFGSTITLDKLDVIYPAFAFGACLIIFFILCWYLSQSKAVGLIASAILAYSPAFLQRTTGGVSSHEALGMPFMFLAILVFAISYKHFNKSWTHTVLFGITNSFCLALSLFSWSGASNFLFMMLPIIMTLYYFFAIDDEDTSKKIKFTVFNLLLVVTSVLIMPLIGYHFSDMYTKFLSNYGLAIPVLLLFFINDTFYGTKKRLFSIMTTAVMGLVAMALLYGNPIHKLVAIYNQILYPMGLGRVGLTVAYYAQPYITDLMSQEAPAMFWMFVIGMTIIGVEIASDIDTYKHKTWFVLVWVLSLLGMMFSRTSATGMFNGTNFVSQIIYFGSFLLLIVCFILLYMNGTKIKSRNIILFAWMFVMLLSARSAVRVLFIIDAFVSFAVAFATVKLYEYAKEKEDLEKIMLYIFAVFAILIIVISLFGNPLNGTSGTFQQSTSMAKSMGPIASYQWQSAMSWVRANTSTDAVFLHWWDYGYQVQTLGNRTTILDGGNANVYWDYLMGRYVLTTPNSAAALSFMKTHNVSYLIIDPTDLGKYGAYSKIGSNDKWDRFSAPYIIVIDDRNSIETANATINVYSGTNFVDEDIYYNGTFIPGPSYDENGLASYNSYIIGITMEVENSGEIKQPQAIYYYNNLQYKIPIRYLYLDDKMFDYQAGINSTFRIITKVDQSNLGLSINNLGAGMYLSPKVTQSLFAQLYLMNDPFKNYPTMTEANVQNDYVVNVLRQQGADIGEFVYFNGLRAPLKIWNVTYPSNVLSNENFMASDGEYGGLDNSSFVK